MDPALERVVEALARGVSLRFESPVFAELGRPVKSGPTYSCDAVLRAVKLGRGRLVVTAADPYSDIQVRAPVQRTSEALKESIPNER